MLENMPIVEARNKLTTLPEVLDNQEEPGAIAVTRHGKPVLAVMSWEFYETLLETMGVISDEALAPLLRKSLQEASTGKILPWDAVKKELGL